VRIISGIFKGRQIRPPRNFKARPTTDFAKESLFNILANHYDFEELDVLDLFSGTGSIAYEFASRGARSVVAVEMAQPHFKFIQDTCRALELEQITPIRTDAFRYLKKPYQSFDVIFADPPYDHPELSQLPELVISTSILEEGGIFILEHPKGFDFSAHQAFSQHRKYGGVNFTMFTKNTA
jgi:16S rRNA (guanine(966)-N(2))-methyltransferase RsmD